jgi:hypothetical protein
VRLILIVDFLRGFGRGFMRACRSLWPDAEFTDLPWQGWEDCRNQSIETETRDCETAVFILTQRGYVVTGINRSAKLLHINTPGRIALGVCEPYNNSRASFRGMANNMRNCTHGKN